MRACAGVASQFGDASGYAVGMIYRISRFRWRLAARQKFVIIKHGIRTLFQRGHEFCNCSDESTSAVEQIMFSVWWLLGAFVFGGYAGILLIALMMVARKSNARDLRL
jgi:hypothetical protein